MNFIFNLAKDKDLKDSLKMQKADGVVMSIMNENPENKEVQAIGAKALSLLLTSADLMMQSHAKIEGIEQKIDNAPRKYIKPLVTELNQLLSGTKMKGAVDSKSADSILKLVNRTLNRMEIYEDKGIVDGVEDARIACYQLVGQLATLQLQGVDLTDATKRLVDRILKNHKQMSTRERIAALNALSDLMKDPNALKIITAKGPELSAVLMEMAQNDKEVSRSAQKISLALTKFSLMDGMKVAGQKMSLRNVLMQLASGGEGSGKHHMGVYVVFEYDSLSLIYIFTRLSQSYHFYHLYHSFRSEENHSNSQRSNAHSNVT